MILPLLALLALAPAQAATKSEELSALTAELQSAPDDFALRERIVKLALSMKRFPAVPKEAKRPLVRAATFHKDASSSEDYLAAVAGYKEALLIAPWLPQAYRGLGLVQESIGELADGIENLKLYLLTSPSDAGDIEAHVYAMEARKEMAARQAPPEALPAAMDPDTEAAFMRGVEGARFIYHDVTKAWKRDWTVTVREGAAVWGQDFVWTDDGHDLGYTENCSGRILNGIFRCKFGPRGQKSEYAGFFARDGRTLRMMAVKDGKETPAFGQERPYERY